MGEATKDGYFKVLRLRVWFTMQNDDNGDDNAEDDGDDMMMMIFKILL